MKLLYLLVAFVNCEKFIKNININSCRNCIHYIPSNNNYDSYLSKCEKFGTKNIITDEIIYDFADSCRNNEEKCGNEGKYFEEEKNINLKIYKNKLVNNITSITSVSFLILLLISIIFNNQ